MFVACFFAHISYPCLFPGLHQCDRYSSFITGDAATRCLRFICCCDVLFFSLGLSDFLVLGLLLLPVLLVVTVDSLQGLGDYYYYDDDDFIMTTTLLLGCFCRCCSLCPSSFYYSCQKLPNKLPSSSLCQTSYQKPHKLEKPESTPHSEETKTKKVIDNM